MYIHLVWFLDCFCLFIGNSSLICCTILWKAFHYIFPELSTVSDFLSMTQKKKYLKRTAMFNKYIVHIIKKLSKYLQMLCIWLLKSKCVCPVQFSRWIGRQICFSMTSNVIYYVTQMQWVTWLCFTVKILNLLLLVFPPYCLHEIRLYHLIWGGKSCHLKNCRFAGFCVNIL